MPVFKDVDRKGIEELSQELGAISKKARDGKLAPGDMQGGCFTISSLGGIGGTDFTPIVNAPEVAILGVVRSKMAPVWDGKEFRAAADAAALRLLRPPRDRRRARRPLHPPPVPRPRGRAPAGAVRGTRRWPSRSRSPTSATSRTSRSSRSTSSAGQKIGVDDPLITLESDKATMDIPAPQAGTVAELKVKLGDRVSMGSADPAAGARGCRRHPAQGADQGGRRPRLAASPRATARVPAPTRRWRSRSPTSATSRTCRSSRSTSPRATRSRPRTR